MLLNDAFLCIKGGGGRRRVGGKGGSGQAATVDRVQTRGILGEDCVTNVMVFSSSNSKIYITLCIRIYYTQSIYILLVLKC